MALPLQTFATDAVQRLTRALRVPRFMGASHAAFWQHVRVDTEAGPRVNADSALSLTTIHRCVSLLSDTISSAPWRVVQDLPGGGLEVDTASDVARALAEYLPYQSKELFCVTMLAGGNGFCIKHTMPGTDAISDLIVTGSAEMTVCVDDEKQTAVYLWNRPDGQSVEYAEQDVAHSMFRAIDNRWIGESPIATCADAVGASLAARRFMSTYYANAGAPGFVLVTRGRATEETNQRLRETWQTSFRETPNAVAVLPENLLDVKPLPVGQNAQDANAVAANSFFVREMTRLYGVPLSWVSETQDVNRATAAEESRQLAHSVKPHAVRIADAFSRMLFSPSQRLQGWRVDIDLTALMLGTGGELADYWSQLVNAGIATPNEARNGVGLQDTGGGDTLRAPKAMAPIREWLAGESPQESTPVERGEPAPMPASVALRSVLDPKPITKLRYGPIELTEVLRDV